jgi:hypothetical protein
MISISSTFSRMAARGLQSLLGLSVLAALAILFTAAPLNAQLTGKGTITGTVADSTGAVIPNATVTATNTANGIASSTLSTGTGDFTLSNLDPGNFTVSTTAAGFEKLTQENVHVNATETVTYKAVLQVGSQSQEVTVTAEPPQIETSNATLGATMEQETYSELPVEMGAYGQADQRRATDFVYLMPGVQGNETNGNATTNTGVINGSGSRGAASDVYIDGVPFVRAGGNGDPRFVWTALSVDSIDQFQVQTNGYSAVYEGQGVMNYSVKQGGIKLHGAVYEFFRNTALDTWGFLGPAPNPATGLPVKPIEHSNEYGINLGGPLIPVGSWAKKVFFFGNYNGFRYTSATPTPMTFPTAAEQSGDFSAYLALSTPVKIYDPYSQAACTAKSTNGFCRYQYGYGPGATAGTNGNPVLTGTANVIPAAEITTIAKAMQSFLPKSGISTALQNNYIAPNATGLVNWSMTDRIDYLVGPKDTLSFVAAIGRQASSVPVGQATAGRNVGPVPYNYGQAYAPKTAVGIIEETHTFTPNLLNQVKWGYARYNGPTFNPNQNAKYSATSLGLSGLPVGQAQQTFPIVTFAGSNPPTNWGGTTANVTLASNYTILDNLQWNTGKHSFTFGLEYAWMQYNTISATGGTTPLTLAASNTETGGISGGSYTIASNTGVAYASFLVGQVDKGSLTDYSLHPGYGARFRPFSPYIQDNWKVSKNLTLDVGLRYDFYPTVTEDHSIESFFNPYLTNPATNLSGALQFTGFGTNTCSCETPVQNYKSNWGPRLGAAYQLGSKTVVRGSYGVMFSHGDAVGGLATSLGTLGFSTAPSFASTNDVTTMPGLADGGNGALPTYANATGVSSGPAFGTGYLQTASVSGTTTSTPSGFNYDDPYLGSRAPEYINWSLGLQRQLTSKIAATVAYVGSQGHFLQSDSLTGRGYWSDQMDPKYLVSVGSHLADTGKTATTVTQDCTTYNLTCTGLSIFNTSQALSTLLKPFPFQSVSDSFGYVGNSNYNAVQATVSLRNWNGVTASANYTYSKAIDDAGYYRTGYAIPSGALYQSTASYPADRIERGVSTSNQPSHFVTTVVWKAPFGKTILADSALERDVLGGFSFSGIFQYYSGSPIVLTMSTCQSLPAAPSSSFCPPSYNTAFTGPARQNGKYGQGVTYLNYNTQALSYINSNAFVTTPSYFLGNTARTAADGLYGPDNYQLDLGMNRSFPLHLTETTKLDFRAEWYNVTNHTTWSVASAALGASTFGTVTPSATYNRKAAQFTARLNF